MSSNTENDADWPITEAGLWLDQRMTPLVSPRPALFLDRDGVIVHDTGFLSDPSSVTLLHGVAALIKRANDAGVPVLVVTNQSGIDRGLFGWKEFSDVEDRIADLLAEQGAATNATAACPFHPDYTPDFGATQARWRKPQPGMILTLAETFGIELSGSHLIGDRERDIEAARNAGLGGGFLLASPSGDAAQRYHREFASPIFTFECGDSIARAGEWVDGRALFHGL